MTQAHDVIKSTSKVVLDSLPPPPKGCDSFISKPWLSWATICDKGVSRGLQQILQCVIHKASRRFCYSPPIPRLRISAAKSLCEVGKGILGSFLPLIICSPKGISGWENARTWQWLSSHTTRSTFNTSFSLFSPLPAPEQEWFGPISTFFVSLHTPFLLSKSSSKKTFFLYLATTPTWP